MASNHRSHQDESRSPTHHDPEPVSPATGVPHQHRSEASTVADSRAQPSHSMHASADSAATVQHHHRDHTSHDAAAGHDRHAGHSVEMFRQKFWGTLLLSIPTVIWSPMIQHWFGYTAPGGAVASRWIPAVFGTLVFAYGGWVFVRGAVGEIADDGLE